MSERKSLFYSNNIGLQILVLFLFHVGFYILFLDIYYWMFGGLINPENAEESPKLAMLIGGLIWLSTYIVSIWVFFRIFKLKFFEVVLFKQPNLKWIVFSILILGTSIFIVEILHWVNIALLEQFPTSGLIEYHQERMEYVNNYLAHNDPGQLFISLFAIALLPAVAEEIFYRAILIDRLTKVGGNKHMAILISALIFAAIHFQPANMLPILFMGLLFGYIYVQTRNIFYSMFIHFLNNGLQIVAMYFVPEWFA